MPEVTGKVQIHVTEDVTLEHLHTIVDTIVGLSGCRTCGLLGIDLQLSGDPAE